MHLEIVWMQRMIGNLPMATEGEGEQTSPLRHKRGRGLTPPRLPRRLVPENSLTHLCPPLGIMG